MESKGFYVIARFKNDIFDPKAVEAKARTTNQMQVFETEEEALIWAKNYVKANGAAGWSVDVVVPHLRVERTEPPISVTKI